MTVASGDGVAPAKDVVVMRAFSLMEADLIRAALGEAGIPAMVSGEYSTNTLAYLGVGLNPKGVPVLVSSDAAARAAEVVSEWRRRRKEGAKADLTPDAWARGAWRASLLQLFYPVLFVAGVYDLVKARRAAKTVTPSNPKRYRRDMRRATTLLALVFPPVLIVLLVLAMESFFHALGTLLIGFLTAPG